MTDWEILRYVHQLGSPIKGTVVAREDVEVRQGIPVGNLTLNTSSPYRALLPAIHLVDDLSAFSQDVIPSIGQEIEAVVFNFVDGIHEHTAVSTRHLTIPKQIHMGHQMRFQNLLAKLVIIATEILAIRKVERVHIPF